MTTPNMHRITIDITADGVPTVTLSEPASEAVAPTAPAPTEQSDQHAHAADGHGGQGLADAPAPDANIGNQQAPTGAYPPPCPPCPPCAEPPVVRGPMPRRRKR